VAAISAHGEIDASNAGNLADYARGVLAHCPQCRCLILDLGGLDFFGTEGISTMDTVRDRCAHGAVRYALVPSAADSRVLRICDPAGAHVAPDTVDAALATLHDHPDRARHSLAAP
jgi:anti-anti-sigma factor